MPRRAGGRRLAARGLQVVVAVCLLAAQLPQSIGWGAELLKVDGVLVLKAERKLQLLRDGEVLRSYPIRLGPNPAGPKIFEFDGRTPEGSYVIDRRNYSRHFHRALHISYPNPENEARARRYDTSPGGEILIHGTPGEGGAYLDDWTDGCIAVSNRAIEEIWAAVDDGTPIEIRP